MEDPSKKITGYRTLSQAEVDLMNDIKAQEAQWNSLIDRLKAMGSAVDQRNVSIAATDAETAFMRAVRAVAQPERKTA